MPKKNISLLEFESNPNIGFYMFANDKFALLGKEVDEKVKEEMENILTVPLHSLKILNSELLGMFIAGNNDYLITPPLEKEEKETLSKICKKYETKIIEIDDNLNALGNNLILGDSYILANSNYSKELLDNLAKQTKLKIIKLKHENYENPGSIATFANSKFFLSQEIEESQVKPILKQVGGVGTVNSGNNFVSSGIVANKFGILIGSASTTVEIQNIVESLDFL